MEESPKKQQPTSRVIDSLHSQIDTLKDELENLRVSHADYKKKHSILSTKNESLVDQLANCKHENDMINALLKRKERRIADLEEQFDELHSLNELLKVSSKNLKIRCDNLQESSATLTAEYERLKIAYDALMASQNEYKRHYQEELNTLLTQFADYKAESLREYDQLTEKFNSNDKDVDTLLDSLANKRKVMDNIYVNRNKAVLQLLATLAKAAKAHGEESKSLLLENVNIINLIREKFPDLQDKIAERTETTVDLDELLLESSDTLDVSFSDVDLTVSEESKGGIQRASSTRRRRHKRNSMRASPDPSDTYQSDNLPRQRNPSRGTGSRNPSGESQQPQRQFSQGTRGNYAGKRNSQYGNVQNYNPNLNSKAHGKPYVHNPAPNMSNTANKNNKRRSFYGGSNNYNSSHERKDLFKAES